MDVLYTRIVEKITELENLNNQFRQILPNLYSDYESNYILKLASERHFEKILECLLKINSLLIRRELFGEEKETFSILFRKKIIDDSLYLQLRRAKGMRNFIIHQYETIDDEVVFDAFSNDVCKTINSFITAINIYLRK